MNKTSDVLSSQKYFVYTLFSLKDNKFYVGFTTDIHQRINDHKSGYVTATNNRLPIKLIHFEYFSNREDAIAREKFFKSGFGREQMRLALKKTLEELVTQIP